MFGILRIVLAALVATSHCGVLWAGMNPGVAAVVVFYLLAGFIMADQITRYFPAASDALRFYRDRALRIFPLYLTFMLLALTFVGVTGYHQGYMSQPLTFSRFLQNLFVIPLNFYMFTGIDHTFLLPPTWSLGAELQFYLLAPWLLRHRRLFLVAFFATASVFLLAASGVMNTDIWGYRLLAGNLFLFLTGAALRKADFRLQAAALVIAAMAGGIALLDGHFEAPYLREEIIGLYVGVLLINLLSRVRPSVWDIRIGYLAYGVFLAQFIPIWWFQLHPIAPQDSVINVMAVIAVALLLAGTAYWLVDRPMAHWRRLHRRRQSERASAIESAG